MDTANEIRTSKISLRKLQRLRLREKIVKEDMTLPPFVGH
jgi:hypothetical protein